MAHHKRKRAKQRRAGCLHCKPFKHPGAKGCSVHQTRQERKARLDEREQRQSLVNDT